MATIILDSAASNTAFADGTTELTPQDGDIYILQSDALSEFRFLGDADFEVRIEDPGPYSQDNVTFNGTFTRVTLSFEDTTNPTVTYADGVDAERVQLNANGDSLTVIAGDNVTLGPIIGSGEEKIPSMPSGDGLNADGGGLTITTGSGTTVTSTIDGPSSGADANYTFGEGNEFWTGATVTGSVGGNTTIVVGDNAVVSANAGFVAPLGDLNGNTQSITIGNNAVNDPATAPAWEVTVAGTNGEKTIDIGDNVTVGEVGFGSEGTVSLNNGFDNNMTFVNPTGGTLTAGENLKVNEFIWGTEGGSTYILGDGWDVRFDLSGAGENNGDDPADKLILGEPAIQGGDTGVLIGSGNDQISIMPPTSSPAETADFINSATAAQWAENDDGSWSPTIANSNDLVYDMGIYTFGAGSPGPAPNQIVDGENDAEFMGDGYDDANGPTNSGGDIIDGADGDNDVILGNGGNDTINAGAGTDEVYGGSGNDVIDGGAGNDTLTGDFASDVTDTVVDNSTVEGDDILEGGAGDDVIYGDSGNSLSAGGEGVPGNTLGDGPGSTGGGYDRISAQSVYNGNHSFSTDAFYLGNDIPVLDDANRDAITGVSFSQDGVGTDRSFGLDELTFTGAQRSFVGLVTVQDSDVHIANDQFSSSISGGFQDTTVVSSGTADFTMNDGQVFQGIRVNYVRGPDGETYMMPDDGPSPYAFNSFRNMLATNDSGIDSFTIATGSGDDAGINPIEGNWADGQFPELTEGDGGDDTIIGGEGADTMFGEGGDDTFIVGSADEGAGDVISGGNGPDENTDNDVLDLTGAGPVTISATADANDAGAQSGTVTFADGSTLTFEGIETIIQDPDNTAPTANDDVTNTAEGTAVQVNVLANDTDPEGGDLDILGTPTAANGTVAVDNETGEITYTPDPGFVGTDTITYTTVDEGGLTDTATLTVNVAASPDSGPDAIDDSITVFESEGAGDTDGNVLTNDLQEAGEPGPYTGGVVEVNGVTGNVGQWIDLPEGGRVLINSDGSVDFDANGDFEGLNDGESENVTIDYCIQTTSGASTGANPGEGPTINVGTTLTNLVTVGGAGAETFAVGGDGDLIGGTAIAVTGNLLPPLFFGNDNDTLDVSDAVAQGWTPTELVRLPDQPLIGNGFSGSFLLTKDGELPVTVTYLEIENFVGFDNVTEKDAATLTVTVQGEDDAPITNPDTATTDEDTPVTIDPLANDVDPDGQPLAISGTPTSPNGTVTVNPDGTIEFTPDPDFNGPTTIDYIAVDPDGNETPGQITVDVAPVDDAPMAEDDTASTAEDTPVTIDVLANDTDADGQPLSIVGTPTSPNGTVAVNPDGTIEFTPEPDFNGDTTITYTVTDPDGNEDTATVTVSVLPEGDAPITNPDTATTDEDTPVTIDPLANDVDPDGQPLAISGTPTSPNGTVTVNPDGTIEFTPDPDFNGPTTIDYIAVDPDGNETPGQITVDVAPVDDAPMAEDDTASTAEDTPVTIDVLANDTDADGQPLSIVGTPTSPNGTVAVNPDGTIEFTPEPDFNGDTTITYTVTDPDGNEDTATVTVSVLPEGDAPITNPDTATTDEDTPVTIDPLANDVDPDGQPLAISGTPTSPNGTVTVNPDGTIEFTPDPDFNGPTTIDYIAVDPDGNETPGQITVDVAPVDDAPMAEDDTASTAEDTPVTIDVLANDTDADGQPLSIVGTPTSPNGTVAVNPDGTIEFTPEPDFNGDTTITYTVTDPDGNEDTATVTVSVLPEGDAPITNPDTATTDEDTPVTIDPLANDVDPDGQPLAISGTPTSPNGTVTVNPDGTIEFTPDPDFNGPTTIDYIAVDPDGNETPGQITVDVAPVDDAPMAEDDTASTAEDTPVTIDVLANDTDADGQPLSIVGTPTSPNGTVAVNPDGTIEFTPEPDFNGDTTITYTVTDPDGNEDTATVTVSVLPEGDAPITNPDTATTDEDTPVTIDPLANDVDPDGQPLAISGTPTSPNGTVTVNPDGTIEFTPDPDFNGPTTIDYIAVDPDGNETPGQITVDVAPVDDAPMAEDDTASTAEDTPVTIDVLANDTDADGQPLSIVGTPTSPNGTVAVNPDGTIEFTPEPDFNGDTTITYTVTDPDGNEDTATVTVSVLPEGDAPITNPDTATTDEDTPVTIDPLANDVDPDGQPLAISGTPTSPNGTVTVNPDGTIEFTPDPDFNGPTTIDYIAVDPDGNETPGQITVDVAPVNDAPDAVDDRAATDFATPVTIDVLANDTDAENDPLTITNATVPAAQGTVAIVAGQLVFTPADGFEGDAVISYTVSDGDLTDTADVVVTVGDNPADGVVDGAEDGEVMNPGYTDPQGDQIDGDDGINDSINGNGGDDTINAGEGDDTVSGGTGNDTIDGGTGDDDVTGDAGDDVIDGNEGDDSIDGGAGEDTLDGGDGDDFLDGGADNDSIIGGDGNDTVHGGGGEDIIDTSNPNADALPDVGYPEQPSATLPITFPGYDADDDPNDDKDVVFGGAGNDTIITGDDDDTIEGGSGADRINAGFDDDTVRGDGGNDFIEGGEGNDFIEGGEGNDLIFGGLQDPRADAVSFPDDEPDAAGFQDLVPENNGDELFGGAGNDTIYGQDDDDSLFGGDGRDALFGGVDDDLIEGNDGDDLIVGGQGADDMSGGLGSDRFVIDAEGDGTNDVVVGGEDPDDSDNDVLDLTGSNVDRIEYEAGNPEAGTVFFADGATMTFSEIETVIPCFTPGTLIATAKGQRLVEDLQPGDRVMTRDNGFQEIAWVGHKTLTGHELLKKPALKPVFVKAGSLGNDLPERDMMLSPNHKLLVSGPETELYFDENEVFVAAKHLLGKPGVQQVDVARTTYVHFMFERHEVVLSDGAWTESFHPGDYTMNGIEDEARAEILALFPELATDKGLSDYRLARTELKKHEARLLIS